jgi:hypothetical protein
MVDELLKKINAVLMCVCADWEPLVIVAYTEQSERLHIDLAKDAYRATNRKDEYVRLISGPSGRCSTVSCMLFSMLDWSTGVHSGTVFW